MNSYFSHDSNARNDEKIARLRMKHGSAGYGVYFMILERLREAKDYMSIKDYNIIAFDLRDDSQLIKSVVEDFGLFAFVTDKDRGECFYSKSFNDRMVLKDEKSKKRAEAGKKGAAKRWGGKNEANPLTNNSNAIAKPSKKIASKVKESKLNKSNVVDGVENNPVDLWTTLWGFPNGVAQTDLSGWRERFGDELVYYAISYAGRRNVQAAGADHYLEKVFRGWTDLKITTVEQAQEEAKKHEQRQSNSRGGFNGSASRVKEHVPDWAEDDYKPDEQKATPEEVAKLKAQIEAQRKSRGVSNHG